MYRHLTILERAQADDLRRAHSTAWSDGDMLDGRT